MTQYDVLYEIAVDNYGLVTVAKAERLGISRKAMNALTARGRLLRRGYGVYKLVHYIPTPYDIYAEAVALVGSNAYLYGESVISMLELAPTNLARIFVATPARMRKTLPEHIIAIKADYQPTNYDGVPSQNVTDAIRVSMKSMMSDKLIDAVEEARRQGYVKETERIELLGELKRP
jgi:predicted transcriptional regulator of viral defense system